MGRILVSSSGPRKRSAEEDTKVHEAHRTDKVKGVRRSLASGKYTVISQSPLHAQAWGRGVTVTLVKETFPNGRSAEIEWRSKR